MITIRAMPIDAPSDGATEPYERSLAIVISAVLHVLMFLLIWGRSAAGGFGESDVAGKGEGPGISVDLLKGGEFRQKIDLVAEPEASPVKAVEIPAAIQVAEPLRVEGQIEAIDDPSIKDVIEVHPTPPEQGGHPIFSSSNKYSDGLGSSSAGGSGEDGLRAKYLAALKATIGKQWSYNGEERKCSLILKQSIGGSVQSAFSADCDFDPDVQRRLEAAALMAQPLPYTGFESVFTSEVRLDIYPEE